MLKRQNVKLILISLLISYSLDVLGQNVDCLGVNNKIVLNSTEATWFNNWFKTDMQKEHYFDFNGARTGFIYIDQFKLTTKKNFFDRVLYKNSISKDHHVVFCSMILDSIGAHKTGLDVVIMIAEKPLSINTQRYNDNCLKLTKLFQSRNQIKPQNIDELGNDTLPLLTNDEARYFNEKFRLQNFNFGNKRVAFLKGNKGKYQSNKCNYFAELRDRWTKGLKEYEISDQLIVLNELERQQTKEYDAIIVSWSKIMTIKNIDLMNKIN
ncbi:MAG: hypothetical protein Q8928_18090 [Bacteroidota bacterium]|nr:hypothetical protein [Bacteroidota bacterium]